MATTRGKDDIQDRFRNKDTCPRSRLKRRRGGHKSGRGDAYIRVVIVTGRVAVHKPRGGRELFSQVPGSPLWAPRARRCSIGRGWILFTGYQPSITEKRLYSRGAFNPDAGFLSRLEAADHLFLRGVPLFGDGAEGEGEGVSIRVEKHRAKVDFNNFYRKPWNLGYL